ncbi:MAG: LptF/LptG family permease [Acidobacteria bacterium]|nr:LptF/LptG family permease [Acidobacteriota bacterium]
MKTLDRYVLRETLGPLSLALGLFTFLFAVRPMLDHAQALLAKGIELPTVAFLLMLLLPQALGITIPMAFMASVLMALGRLSGDREGVALLACGVSPLRLLRPLMLLAVVAGLANFYTLTRLVPDSNQRFREETFRLLVRQSEGDIKPGVFYQGFPGKMLYVRERLQNGAGWAGVVLADVSQPSAPVLTVADRGRLEIDPDERQVAIVLPGLSYRYIAGRQDGVYDTATAQDLRFAVPADSVFPDGNLSVVRGRTEMGIADLRAEEVRKRDAGLSPHNEIMQRHQMFSFPVACAVFAVIGLALGLHTRKDGKLGGFTLGIAVICAYYGVMALFENLTKGGKFPAEWARWMPNVVLAIVGILALWLRTRSAGREMALTLPRLRWPLRSGRTAAAPPRIVIVVRLPAWHLPRPRLLDLYVGRRYLNVVAVSFLGLLAFYYIGTFIDKSERLFKGQADAWMLVQYFYYSTPQFIAYVMPMAILLAVLATIGGLMRSGELVVMRSCGVSLYRAAMPLVVLAFVWGAGLFLLDDRVLAHANRRAETLEETIKGNPPRIAASIQHANWLLDSKRRIYYYTAFDSPRQVLYGLSVFETTDDPFQLASHAWVTKATYTRQGWRAEQGWVQRFAGADRSVRETFHDRVLNLDPPSRFPGLLNQDVELMTYGELRRQVRELAQSGLTLADSQVRLQSRVAFPFVAVVMTLLGIPFGATTGRRGALYGVGVAVILGSVYWMMDTFFLAVGQAALLPAALAAWAANILFLAAAAYLTLTVRT